MKWKVRNLDDENGIFETSEGDWHESPAEAVKAKIAELESELPQWSNEAHAAIDRDDLYRGGGVLRLAELMRQLTTLRSELKTFDRFNESSNGRQLKRTV